MLKLDQVLIEQDDFRLHADWALERQSLCAVIGPSGGGKSTLLATIAGFLEPVKGAVYWNGVALTGLAPGQRPVAILFQDNNLFPHLTVAQNVGLGLQPKLHLTKDETMRVDQALTRVGLEHLGKRKPAALSGGQQSRVALARVLLSDKPLVLLDEPFAALGPGLRAEMLELAKATLKDAGRTTLMVTHDPQDALRIADNIVLVDSGAAQAPAPTQELMSNPPAALRDYLGS